MNQQPVGIQSVAVKFPSGVRTNDYWRQYYPELVDKAEQKSLARAFSPKSIVSDDEEAKIWKEAMMPYISDPFRGIVERRVLATGETSLTLEYGAAVEALKAAELAPKDVDLTIVVSLFPEQIAPGNAAYLAGKLGLQCGAWNLESTCSSSIVALQTASALVRSGEYRNILVVLSTIFSRYVDENDTFSFLMGDGAAAFVVRPLTKNQGLLSTKLIHTAKTCDSFYNELAIDSQGNPRMYIRVGKNASQMLHDEFVKSCRFCCSEALVAAGLTIEDVDFFISNTNTAWYSSVYTKALGIKLEKTVSYNPSYANIGAPSPIVNLFHALQSKKIRENDLVLMYTFGGTSNAGASVMRWGDVALGPLPDAPTTINVSLSEKHKSFLDPSVVLA